MEDREHESQVAGDGGLEGEDLLDELLDPVVALVDLVVERDHLVAELGVLRLERVERAAQGPQADVALLLQARLEPFEALPVLDPHPNLPVT